jgi:hypothetical protein
LPAQRPISGDCEQSAGILPPRAQTSATIALTVLGQRARLPWRDRVPRRSGVPWRTRRPQPDGVPRRPGISRRRPAWRRRVAFRDGGAWRRRASGPDRRRPTWWRPARRWSTAFRDGRSAWRRRASRWWRASRWRRPARRGAGRPSRLRYRWGSYGSLRRPAVAVLRGRAPVHHRLRLLAFPMRAKGGKPPLAGRRDRRCSGPSPSAVDHKPTEFFPTATG